jgi:adenylate cyclase
MKVGFRRSPELTAIVRRYLQAYGDNDVETVMNLYTDGPATSYIGTADGEVWDSSTLRVVLPAYMETKPEFSVDGLDVTAFERGPVGFALVQGSIELPATGKQVTIRATYVLELVRGVWRVVHIHHSSPVTNIDNMGYDAKGVEDLLQAASESEVDLGQTGMASVMFTDIVDSTTIAEALRDTLWSALVWRHLDDVGGLIEAGGGRLVKSLGDGTMSTFPSARHALTTACTIQRAIAASETEPRLAVRIGLHTGDLVDAGDDFFGSVVNKAARVAGMAGPDEIRLSDATRVMVGHNSDFVFSEPVSVALKGFEGEHTIYRLEWDA